MSKAGIKRALDELEQAGLITVDRGLHNSNYGVNQDHLLWPALRLALDAAQLLDHRIEEFVRDSGVPVVTVAVFGSVARGGATDESDVDLVVVYPYEPDEGLSVALVTHVERWTGNACQVFDVSRGGDQDLLVESWRRGARTIFGTELRELL